MSETYWSWWTSDSEHSIRFGSPPNRSFLLFSFTGNRCVWFSFWIGLSWTQQIVMWRSEPQAWRWSFFYHHQAPHASVVMLTFLVAISLRPGMRAFWWRRVRMETSTLGFFLVTDRHVPTRFTWGCVPDWLKQKKYQFLTTTPRKQKTFTKNSDCSPKQNLLGRMGCLLRMHHHKAPPWLLGEWGACPLRITTSTGVFLFLSSMWVSFVGNHKVVTVSITSSRRVSPGNR